MINTAWKLSKMYNPDLSDYLPCVELSAESNGLSGLYMIPISLQLAETLSKAYFTTEAQTMRDIMIEGPVIEGSIA